MANMIDVWGFESIVTGGIAAPGPDQVMVALNAGARDRGISNTTHPSDALDASRDVIIDDVVHGVIGGLRRGDHWSVDNGTLYIVWDGLPLGSIIGR